MGEQEAASAIRGASVVRVRGRPRADVRVHRGAPRRSRRRLVHMHVNVCQPDRRRGLTPHDQRSTISGERFLPPAQIVTDARVGVGRIEQAQSTAFLRRVEGLCASAEAMLGRRAGWDELIDGVPAGDKVVRVVRSLADVAERSRPSATLVDDVVRRVLVARLCSSAQVDERRDEPGRLMPRGQLVVSSCKRYHAHEVAPGSCRRFRGHGYEGSVERG